MRSLWTRPVASLLGLALIGAVVEPPATGALAAARTGAGTALLGYALGPGAGFDAGASFRRAAPATRPTGQGGDNDAETNDDQGVGSMANDGTGTNGVGETADGVDCQQQGDQTGENAGCASGPTGARQAAKSGAPASVGGGADGSSSGVRAASCDIGTTGAAHAATLGRRHLTAASHHRRGSRRSHRSWATGQ